MAQISTPEVLEHRIAPAGLVSVLYSEVTGELILFGDGEANAFDILQVAPGVYRIEGAEDATTLTDTDIGEPGNGSTTIAKVTSLTINAGGGNDEVRLANLRTLASLTVDLGEGADQLEAYNLSVKGDTSIETGAGLDEVEFTGLSTTIAKNLVISDVEGGTSVIFAAAQNSIRGAMAFVGGTGSDLLSTAPEVDLTIAKGLSFQGGSAGTDELSFGDQGIINIGRNLIGQSLVYAGGTGNDRLSIGANTVNLKGSVEMMGAGGADVLDLDGWRVSVGKSAAGVSVQLDGGIGEDELDIQGNNIRVAGLVRLAGGADNDLLDLTNTRSLSIQGNVEMDGGTGLDRLEIEADRLQLGRDILFNGGDDADGAIVEGDGFIKGSVNLNLGGAAAGLQDAAVRGLSGLRNSLKIGGTLTVDAQGAAVTFDEFRAENLVVAKAISLGFGEGASDLDIDDITAMSSLTIDTRGGADDVRIETDAVYGLSEFRRAATISLGDGNDALRIGEDSANNRVLILAQLIVRGGAGTDSRNDIEDANRFGPTGELLAEEFEIENVG